MTATEREIIMRASASHQHAPWDLAEVMAAFNALPIKLQAHAINIYLTLLNEPTLPAKFGARRSVPVPKKPMYRHNSTTVKRAAVARRKLEAMRDDKI